MCAKFGFRSEEAHLDSIGLPRQVSLAAAAQEAEAILAHKPQINQANRINLLAINSRRPVDDV